MHRGWVAAGVPQDRILPLEAHQVIDEDDPRDGVVEPEPEPQPEPVSEAVTAPPPPAPAPAPAPVPVPAAPASVSNDDADLDAAMGLVEPVAGNASQPVAATPPAPPLDTTINKAQSSRARIQNPMAGAGSSSPIGRHASSGGASPANRSPQVMMYKSHGVNKHTQHFKRPSGKQAKAMNEAATKIQRLVRCVASPRKVIVSRLPSRAVLMGIAGATLAARLRRSDAPQPLPTRHTAPCSCGGRRRCAVCDSVVLPNGVASMMVLMDGALPQFADRAKGVAAMKSRIQREIAEQREREQLVCQQREAAQREAALRAQMRKGTRSRGCGRQLVHE